jgi:hypothetical protein
MIDGSTPRDFSGSQVSHAHDVFFDKYINDVVAAAATYSKLPYAEWTRWSLDILWPTRNLQLQTVRPAKTGRTVASRSHRFPTTRTPATHSRAFMTVHIAYYVPTGPYPAYTCRPNVPPHQPEAPSG